MLVEFSEGDGEPGGVAVRILFEVALDVGRGGPFPVLDLVGVGAGVVIEEAGEDVVEFVFGQVRGGIRRAIREGDSPSCGWLQTVLVHRPPKWYLLAARRWRRS